MATNPVDGLHLQEQTFVEESDFFKQLDDEANVGTTRSSKSLVYAAIRTLVHVRTGNPTPIRGLTWSSLTFLLT